MAQINMDLPARVHKRLRLHSEATGVTQKELIIRSIDEQVPPIDELAEELKEGHED
jgi:hypothetical protein